MKKIIKINRIMVGLTFLLLAALAVNAGYYVNPIARGAELVVNYISQDPDPAEPGRYVELKFKVENNGTEAAEDVEIEIIPEYPFTLDSGEGAVKSIGTILGRQTGSDAVIVKFKLKVDKDAVSGDNKIDVRYSSSKTGWIKKEDNIVKVRSHFAILSIREVESEPEIIRPGETAKLSIGVENKADALLKDIKVKLMLYKATHGTTTVLYEEKPFAPIGSSNEKTLNNLERGEKEDIVFNLIADPDAEAGVYKIPLVVTYSDNTGKNYSLSDNIIGLVVGDSPELVVFIESSELKAAKKAGNVNIKFVNKGTSDIKFLYSKLKQSEDFEIISFKEVYVGNIDSDDYETAEYKIYLKKAKEVVLPLHIEYKDANNRLYKKNINLPLRIISAKIAGEKSGGSKVVGFLIIIVIVVVGVFIYRKRKRKKK